MGAFLGSTSEVIRRWRRAVRNRPRAVIAVASMAAVLAVPVVLTNAPAFAGASGWVFASDTSLSSSDGQENTDAHPDRTNLCEGTLGIPFGNDPGWARVGGNPSPHTPAVEAHGQVFPDLSDIGIKKTNPFITHTDNPFNHHSLDINVFVTLDAPDRGLLGSGNFTEGDTNEHGEIEVEWERGGLPLFAYPSDGDRITVWGPHVWDCGHGSPDAFRTEIHPPVGWAVFRNTATDSDLDQAAPAGKRTQDPWNWYEATDHQGTGTTLPSTGLLNTPVQATVVDTFFSSFGGNVPESLNGCDDSTIVSDDTIDADCLGIAGFLSNFEWMQAVLDRDYAFFVPAPPKPDPGALLVWESVDHCSDVPSNPGNPPGDDVDDVAEATDGAEDIGSPTCNIPDEVAPATVNGQEGVTVTVKAHSSGVSYPSNGYVAFAKRYKVAWDSVAAAGDRVKTFDVTAQHLRVYDDSEPCGEDGEWNMALRVNESWIYPVHGSGDDGDAFYEDGAIDDDKCGLHEATYEQYSIGETFHVGLVPGEQIHLWARTFDIDPIANDLLPVVSTYTTATGNHEVGGSTDTGVEGAHTIGFGITDTTPTAPTLGTLVIGTPQYGPNADTGGFATRVSAATSIELQGSDAAKLQYRFWKDGTAKPATWTYDDSAPLRVDMTGAADGRYTIEYAPVSAGDIVAERRLAFVERDTTPPTLDLPAPITVYADQTAGKVVAYSATASDNLPGPVTFSCTPPSGSLFPNGHNAPLATTVTCSATDAVGNNATGTFTVTVVSPFGYIPDFVVLGRDWVTVGSGAIVQSGNVGAFDASGGVPNQATFEIVAGPSAHFLGGSQIAADSDRLEASTQAGDVFYVDKYFLGNGATATPKVGYVPLFFGMPAFPVVSGGGSKVNLSGTASLPAGNYGQLTVGPNADVTLTGGAYNFGGIEVKPGATVRFAAASTVGVSGRVLVGNGSTFAPATGVQAHDVVLYGAGVDGPPNKPADAIAIGSNVTLGLNAYAPNGTLTLGSYTVGTGAYVGKRVAVGGNVTLNEDSAFLSP